MKKKCNGNIYKISAESLPLQSYLSSIPLVQYSLNACKQTEPSGTAVAQQLQVFRVCELYKLLVELTSLCTEMRQ